MAGYTMIIAGIGLRASATGADVLAALASGPPPDRLAVPADKAGHPALLAPGLPVMAIAAETLAAQPALTPSPRQPARYGRHSVAEAAALAAAGPGARLLAPRIIGPGGRITLALAVTGDDA